MANSKHVIGFEDNLAKPLQNYAPTMYALGKMRAGRTPKYPDGTVITDANAIYRPGLYFLEPGCANLDNGSGVSTVPAYLYHITEDPDDSINGGHVQDNPVSVGMNARQIRYLASDNSTAAMTRVGSRDAIISTFIVQGSDYQVVPNVLRIQEVLGTDPSNIPQYAFVVELGLWIRYTVDAVGAVSWEPAYQWGLWRSMSGEDPSVKLESDTLAVPFTHYISYGQHQLELPSADECEIGCKVRLDQWAGQGRVITKDEYGNIKYEIDTVPALKTVGLSDLSWFGDDILPDGTTFFKQIGFVWRASVGGVNYVLQKLQIASTGSEPVFRYVITRDNSDVVLRICYDEVEYPIGIHLSYHLTNDAAFQENKTYFVKTVINGVAYYNPATVTTGALVPGETYYEMDTNAHWYDVNGGVGVKTAAEISLSEILAGTPKTSHLTNTDIAGNILGCTAYIFEVTYDRTNPSKKTWCLTRASDMEAYIARLNELLGATVHAHTEQLHAVEATAEAIYNDVLSFKLDYMNAEREVFVRDQAGRIIYGDNAKLTGQVLMTYNPQEYLPISSVTDYSYIIQFFQARLTPIYHLTANTLESQPRTLFLPTVAENLVGKKVKILLEPNSQITVFDDCSATKYNYTFYGEALTEGNPIVLKEITFTLQKVFPTTPTEGRQYELVWTYQMTTQNSNLIYR